MLVGWRRRGQAGLRQRHSGAAVARVREGAAPQLWTRRVVLSDADTLVVREALLLSAEHCVVVSLFARSAGQAQQILRALEARALTSAGELIVGELVAPEVVVALCATEAT